MKDGQKASEKGRGKNSLSETPATKDGVEGGKTRERERNCEKTREREQRLPGAVEFMLDLSLFVEQLAVNGKME